jgi:polyketide cyclase/dehydrase/lipid transport protein
VADYRFLTTWCLEAPIDRAWDAIHDFKRWPEWWDGVESVVEVEPGDENGAGNLSRHMWRSRIPYAVRFDVRTTRVERPFLIEGTATGELAGEGRWRLFEARDTTAVLYEWNVRTTRAWMNLVAPVARPVFAWNHHWVMRQGGEGLARLLGARLLARS